MARAAIISIVVGMSFLAPFSVSLAVDWDSCADDLDRLRRASRDASDVANDVKSKTDDFENCRRFPDVYDLLRDRCQSKRWDYQSAMQSLKSELDTVDSRIRSVRLSCGYNLSSIEGPPTGLAPSPLRSQSDQLCELYRSYRGRLPMQNLLELCRKSISDAECRKCLAQ